MARLLAMLGIAVMLGVDSLRASVALGLLRPSRRRQLAMILAFGICDGVAVSVGALIGREALAPIGGWIEVALPAALAGYAVYLIVGPMEVAAEGPAWWHVVGVPLGLSLDNLVAGVGLQSIDVALPIIIGVLAVSSSLLSALGLCAGTWLARRLPVRTQLAGGVALLLLSVVMISDP